MKLTHLIVKVAVFWLLGMSVGSAQIRYTVSADGSEVTDGKTSLIWRRCSEGQSWSNAPTGCTGTASTFTHEHALAHAQTQAGWRLPSVKELSSIANKSRAKPAIDVTAFPGTPSYYFRSSSPYVGAPNFAWLVDFHGGSVNASGRNLPSHVRLVR